MNTYSDMVTLLLCFFAVMLSMSTVNEEKFNAFIRSFSNLPPDVIEEIIGGVDSNNTPGDGTEPTPEEAMDMLYEYISEYVAANDAAGVVDVSKENGMIYIHFNTALLFESDSYILTADSYPTLEYIGKGLKDREQYIKMVALIGHTADPMDGTLRSSGWMLSGERASSIASYLEYTIGFEPKKVVTMGYGKHYPVADNSREETRMLNRRVEMIIVGMDSDLDVGFYDALGRVYDAREDVESGMGQDLFEQTGGAEPEGGADLPEQTGGTPPESRADLPGQTGGAEPGGGADLP